MEFAEVASKSKSQQRFMGMVNRCKETGECVSKEVEEVAGNMKKKDVKDYASTKHKGLPEKVKKPKEKRGKKRKKKRKNKKRSFDMTNRLKNLIKIANALDDTGLVEEADLLDDIMTEDFEEEHGSVEEEFLDMESEISEILAKHGVDMNSELARDLIAWCEKHEHEEIRDGGETEETMLEEESALGIEQEEGEFQGF